MGESEPTRRGVLAAAAALLAVSRAEASEGSAPPGGDLGSALVGAATVAEVSLSDAERAQLAASFEALLELVRARRRFDPPVELAPATVFDPRLRGRGYGPSDGPAAWTQDAPPKPPRKDEDLAFAPVTHLARWIADRELTSERITTVCLDRLDGIGRRLNAVVLLRREQALAAARAADAEIAAGRYRGPLHGIPWGAKDLVDVAGEPTTWGAAPYRDRVGASDAVVVKRMAEAGAVLVAKLSLGALAMGDVWFGGTTRNPWNPDEGSSGSSAGPAAAVAAGLVPLALGSETLGSIVSPSMRCGVTGLRPTFGRVPRTGAMPLCWSLDKLGPIARTAEDCALALSVLNGGHPGDPGSIEVPFSWSPGEVAGRRVGRDPAWFDGADPLDLAAVDALRAAGVEIVDVALADLPWDGLIPILYAESAAAFESLSLSDRDDLLAAQGDDDWPNLFRQARFLSAVDLVQADRLRRRVMEAMDAALHGVDALIAPSYGNPLLVATNFTGHPSLTLRTGFAERGPRNPYDVEADGPKRRVPHGITLWGGLFEETRLVRLGMVLERRFAVWDARPPR